MTKQVTYKCPKCNGSGFLSQYAGIANGVCFSCEGNGYKVGKPSEGRLWTVSTVNVETGSKEVVYGQRAKTAAEAIAKARKAYARASEQWRNRYDMTHAEAA